MAIGSYAYVQAWLGKKWTTVARWEFHEEHDAREFFETRGIATWPHDDGTIRLDDFEFPAGMANCWDGHGHRLLALDPPMHLTLEKVPLMTTSQTVRALLYSLRAYGNDPTRILFWHD